MTMNPSMKGFQPEAFNSASELRSSGLEEAYAFSEFLPTALQHLHPVYLNIYLLPLSSHFKDSCVVLWL